MTLRAWSEQHGIDVRRKGGAFWVPDCFVHTATRRQLWHLNDCVVTSVTGGVIWLVRREKPKVRTLEYHVTVAVPVTFDDGGDYVIGEPYACEMGTPLNSDTYDPEAEEWYELHRMELPGDADSAGVAAACIDRLFPSEDEPPTLPSEEN